jgi:hypothetical protein
LIGWLNIHTAVGSRLILPSFPSCRQRRDEHGPIMKMLQILKQPETGNEL